MPNVTLSEKNQITLPVSIIEQANLSQNDTLQVSYHNGVITLSTAKVKTESIMDYLGICKGLYGTEAEIDVYVAEERASWE